AEDKVVSCDENLAAPACQIIKNDICANPILNPDTTKSWCNPATCNCETPKPPKVVEECDRKEGQCVTQNLPSPSPWTPNWDDSVTPVKKPKACVNAIITARFDQKMDEASIALNNILVKSCNGENTGCDTKVNPASDGLTVGIANTDQTYFSFYPAAEFSPNTWYQVTLKGGAGGIKAAGVNGLSLEKDYVWNFQTRESSVECSIGCVAVAPSKLTVHDKKSINYQAIPDSEDNACIMINPAPYTWQWSSDKPVKADAAIIEPAKSYLARVTPKEETATNDPVHITAAEQIHKKKGLGELTISFTNFYVVKKWPDCATACRNAEVGILFSDAVDFDSVVTGSGENIELYKCEPADCSTKTKKEIKSGSLQVSKVIPAEINFAPAKILDANARYRVIVKGGASGVKSSLGKWLSDDKGAAQTKYAWDFNTQGVECAVDTVEMRPDKTYAYLVNEKNNHEALPKSKADECSASGQRLIGTGYAWRWSTPEDLTPEVKIAGISNNDFTPADGKIDPAQISTAIGKGTVEKKKLAILTAEREVQATTISAEEASYFKHGQSDYYLICGFHNDNECRDAAGTDKSATYGVGKNSCCYPRPYVESSTPAHTDDPAPEVCRNALMSVTFNEPMDIASFNGNVLVAAKYENAACPENWQYLLLAGADNAPQKVAWLNRAVDWTIKELAKLPLIGKIFNASTALATDYGSNWCVVPGTVGGYNFDNKSYATFAPKELLKAGSEHLVLIKGDKDLTDGAHEGAKNIYGVSTGLPSGASGVICRGDTTGKDCKINGKPFFGQIIKFTALEDKGAENNYGICAADKVKLTPASHLFTTNKNKTGDDTIAQAEVEDFADNDKIFIADALANNEQKIVSISGIYSWEWGWSTDNDAVAKVGERSKDTISSPNKAIIYTDATKRGSTYARGVINIKDDKYSLSVSKTIGGAARIWVLLCNNPWPAYKENWTPFQDSNKNCQAGTGNCFNTNFEFYYCRDQGSTLLNDDLPAIADNGAILRSSEKTGALKEFLFTRPGKPEAPKLKVYTGILPGINCNTGDCNGDGVKDVFDKHFEFVSNKGVPTPNNGKVILIWDDRRSIIGVDTKIHRVYQREQGGAWQEIKDLSITEANCGAEGDRRGCYLLIDNLQNGTAYSFAVSTYNEYGESDFSNIINVTPKRTIAPSSAPTNLTAIISGNSVKLQWTKNTDSDVTNYKVYRGIDEDKNHEVRDAGNVNTYTWQNLDLKRTYYFKVTAAVDKLESAASNVIKIEKGVIK
ncbi:MAG: Ig-like domain-containing protein, partial [Patescibacteria group bacterium]